MAGKKRELDKAPVKGNETNTRVVKLETSFFRKRAAEVINKELDIAHLDKANLLEALTIIYSDGDKGIMELAQDMANRLDLSFISTTHWLNETEKFVKGWVSRKGIEKDLNVTNFKVLVDYITKQK